MSDTDIDINLFNKAEDADSQSDVIADLNALGASNKLIEDEIIVIDKGELETDDGFINSDTGNGAQSILDTITNGNTEIRELNSALGDNKNDNIADDIDYRRTTIDEHVSSELNRLERAPTQARDVPEETPLIIHEDNIISNQLPAQTGYDGYPRGSLGGFNVSSSGNAFSQMSNRPTVSNPFLTTPQRTQRRAPEGLPEFDLGELSLKKSSRELIVKDWQLNSEQLSALKRRLLDEYKSFTSADANQKIIREQKLDSRLNIDSALSKIQEGVAAVRYIEAQAFWTRRAMDILFVVATGAEILSDFLAFPRFNLSGWAKRIKGTTVQSRLVPSLGRLFKQTPWLIRVSSSPTTQIGIEVFQSMLMYGFQNGNGGALQKKVEEENELEKLADVTLLRATAD